MLALKLLLLLLIANGSPVVARLLLGARFTRPIDGGRQWRDGRPLLGPSKTWLGLASAVLITMLVAPLLGLPWLVGMLIGSGAMLGDALSSFVKRRLALASGERATGLDQIPEALIALLAAKTQLTLPWTQVLLLPIAFMLVHLVISRVTQWLNVPRPPQ